MDSKSLKCFFVVYSFNQKAYRFWDPAERKIKISRDVIFDEKNDLPIFTPEQILQSNTHKSANNFTTYASTSQVPMTPIQSINVSADQAEERATNVFQPDPSINSYSTTEPNCDEVDTTPMPNILPDTGHQSEGNKAHPISHPTLVRNLPNRFVIHPIH